jgi:hypothetical protein
MPDGDAWRLLRDERERPRRGGLTIAPAQEQLSASRACNGLAMVEATAALGDTQTAPFTQIRPHVIWSELADEQSVS